MNPIACCPRFAAMLDERDAGIGVIPFHDGDRRVFKLVGRPFDREIARAGGLPPLRDPAGRPVPLVTAIYEPISFCPKCGAALAPNIERERAAFEAAAQAAAAD
jgi:hypothetical protein